MYINKAQKKRIPENHDSVDSVRYLGFGGVSLAPNLASNNKVDILAW
jgi:hypothetical protein